ncbi:nuclear transport factor 2 family protein [Micromonospora sp. NPDC049044]|uniref:nuclear transport factor 2 family protein n=1 Tax=unclassified Micromonospora TaxID=2617518 RepID=UPI00340F9908
MAEDLRQAVEAHTALFNECVRSGDWQAFAQTFTEDARVTFTDLPVPPIVGRDALAAAYRRRPPQQTMVLDGVRIESPDTAHVQLRWDDGTPGAMLTRWRDGMVAVSEITMSVGADSAGS